MTESGYDALRYMEEGKFVRPMDVGAYDASHHSQTMKRLCEKGLLFRKPWGGHIRNIYRYRLPGAGALAIGNEFRRRKNVGRRNR